MEFNVGVIKPVECMKEGWELIKDQYWLFLGITFVGMLLGGLIPFGIALGAMFCGIYYAVYRKERGETPEFGDVFKGFSYFGASIVPMLLIIVPMVIMTLVMYASIFAMVFGSVNSGGRFDEDAFILQLYGVLIVEGVIMSLILGCLHSLIMFAFPLIVDRGLSGLDSFKLSARAVWQNLGGVVGIITLEFLMGIVGYMVCGIGLYFVLPVMFAGVWVAYRRVFPSLEKAGFNVPPPPTAFNI